MKTVWLENKQRDYNTRAIFQLLCSKADKIELVALDCYQIHVNEKFVGFGPAKAAYGYCRKDEYDLSAYENFYITVEVVCYNIPSYSCASGNPLFGCKVYKDGKVIADTDDFICYNVDDYIRKVQKYCFQRGFAEYYVMDSCRSNYYLGKATFTLANKVNVACPNIIERNVAYPLYEKENSVKIENGRVEIDKDAPCWFEDWQMLNNPKLNACFDKEEIPDFVSDTVSKFKYTKDDINYDTLSNKEYATFDFLGIVAGFLNLDVTVQEDAEIYVLWAETATKKAGCWEVDFSRNTCCDIVKYKLKKGVYKLQTLEPYCLRYAKIVCFSGLINIQDFYVLSVKNAKCKRTHFECENKKIEKVFEAARNSLAHNSVDILTDCPGRERAGWLCDGYFMGKAEKLLFLDNSVERNFLENYILAYNFEDRYPKNMIPMCYPSDILSGKFIPNWALWFVLEIADYKERNGYDDIVWKAKEKVYGVIEYFSQFENQEGLLENLSGWILIEWSKSNEFVNGINFPTNMLYCKALELVGALYNDDSLLEKARKLKNRIIQLSYNGEFFEDNRVRDEEGALFRTNNTSETCQYYALYFGFAEGDAFAEYRNRVISFFGRDRDDEKTYPSVYKSNAFIGNMLRLAYLLKAKEYERVLKEAVDYYYVQAELTSTLWEHDTPINSLDHGFGSYVACMIVESLKNTNLYKFDFKYME